MTTPDLTPVGMEPTVRYSEKRKSPETRAGLRMDAYIRYSSKGGRDTDSERFQALTEQRDKIQAWANAKGVEIIEWHTDEAVSGGSMQRPAFNRMMARVRTVPRQTDGVVVARLDRFSRAKPSEAMDVVEELRNRGAVLAALDMPGCDPTTSWGEMVMTVMLQMNRFYRQQIGEKYADARGIAVKERKLYLAPSTPVGYRRVDADGKPVGEHARTARLEVDTGEAAVVTEVFERRAGGEGWGSLRNWLQTTGVRPPARRSSVPDPANEGRTITVELDRPERWSTDHVRHMVKKRVYLGEIGDEHGGVYVDDPRLALTDRDTWDAAQQRRAPRDKKGSLRSPLQGLVHCAGCSYKMGLQSGGSKHHPHDYFYCARQRKAKDCPAPARISPTTDRRYSKNGREFVISMGLVEYVTEAMYAKAGADAMEAEAVAKNARLDELGRLIPRTIELLDKWLDDDEDKELKANLSPATRARRVGKYEAAIAALEAERDQLDKQPGSRVSAESLRELVEESAESHHSALTMMVRGVFVRSNGGAKKGSSPGRVHIVWAGEEMPPVPRHGPGGGVLFPRSVAFPEVDAPVELGVLAS